MNGMIAEILGRLAFGCSIDQVKALLGEPSDVGNGLPILAYQDRSIQLAFREGLLWLVSFYFEPGEFHGWLPSLKPYAGLSSKTTATELEAWLSDHGLPWQVSSPDGENPLYRSSNLSLAFEDGRLLSLQIFAEDFGA